MHRMALPLAWARLIWIGERWIREKQISLLGLESWRKNTKVDTHQRIWLKKVDMKDTNRRNSEKFVAPETSDLVAASAV